VQADDELLRILTRAFPGCAVHACTKLAGGISSGAVAVDLALADGTTRRVVVRRPTYGTAEERLSVVKSEHALLLRCAAVGIPVPKPCFLDADTAAVVLEYVEGAPEFAPTDSAGMLRQMATMLARIHAIPIGDEFSFLPTCERGAARRAVEVPDRLDTSLDEPRIRAVLAQHWPWPQRNADVLLHGDYWPGNMLWRDGRLAAVIDWEESQIGDPLADIAIARLDILWAFGEAAMHEFTQSYRAQTQIDWDNLPRWDLCVALRPMSNLARWAQSYVDPPISRPDINEVSMGGGHRRFVEQALRALGIQK
jgi:aminoglycoside phosphotransferase (APT) family kinase protein